MAQTESLLVDVAPTTCLCFHDWNRHVKDAPCTGRHTVFLGIGDPWPYPRRLERLHLACTCAEFRPMPPGFLDAWMRRRERYPRATWTHRGDIEEIAEELEDQARRQVPGT